MIIKYKRKENLYLLDCLSEQRQLKEKIQKKLEDF